MESARLKKLPGARAPPTIRLTPASAGTAHPRSRAAAARAGSARYDPEPIAERYERLYAQLAADRAGRRFGWLRRLLGLDGREEMAALAVDAATAARALALEGRRVEAAQRYGLRGTISGTRGATPR